MREQLVENHRARVAADQKRRENRSHPEHGPQMFRPVRCLDDERIFTSVFAAARSCGLSAQALRAALKSHGRCGGWEWEWAD